MGKIFFITRSFVLSKSKDDSCAALRNAKADFLKRNHEVIVVTPNYVDDSDKLDEGFVCKPYSFTKGRSLLEHVGLWEDYLKPWVDDTFNYLKDIVNNDDLVIALSGGELGCISLASRLKESSDCRMIIDFHDPIVGTKIHGRQFGNGFRVSREKYLEKYLRQADYIITWGEMYIPCIEEKVKGVSAKTKAIYHGYRTKYDPKNNYVIENCPKKVIYGGTMSYPQKIEKAIQLFGHRDDIVLELIGNPDDVVRREADKHNNVVIKPSMKHEEYMDYMAQNADVGLVSLVGKELGIAAPSKIFELINLEIPILGIMPNGDGSTIINSGYGHAADISEQEVLNRYLTDLLDSRVQYEIRKRMHDEKDKWFAEYLMEDYLNTINQVWGY